MKKDRNDENLQANVQQQADGQDVEFSEHLADHDDLKAQARSRKADQRAKRK